MNPAFLDFETYKIEPRPAYPPKPVGLAWLVDDKKGYEPCRSPSDRIACTKLIRKFERAGHTPVFHNAKFDLDVAEVHLGCTWPAYHHDTLILAYLLEPRAPTFSLKPLAEKYLGEKPVERDKLRDWILENVPKATEKTWGAYISEAPFEMVKPYAIGDVVRTQKLFNFFMRQLKKDDRMMKAYTRELRLTRVLVKMERRGVPVAVRRLSRDLKIWKDRKDNLETSLMKTLKVARADKEEFKWAGKNFAEQVVRSKLVKKLPLTPKGNPSTSTDNLGPLLPPKFASKLELRSQLQTCISTFAEPWLAQARSGGRFYASYNQVRQDYHGDGAMVGTTTGRMSMTPNLQNVIRSDKGDEVPQLRSYLIPAPGWIWLKRDYSQQEFRIFAHYEEGELLERYKANPTIDIHVVTASIITERAGIRLERRAAKDINFGVVYGMGKDKMRRKLMVDIITAEKILAAYHRSLPGVKALQKQLKQLAKDGEPIYTWGGRRYYCEPPAEIKHGYRKGQIQTFDYRLLNLLVQGSAADATKEAMVRYDETGWNEDDMGPLELQVHDELDAMAEIAKAQQAMKVLRECMESIELDIPLLSDGFASKISWDDAEKVTW
jgi:DNA polymerase I